VKERSESVELATVTESSQKAPTSGTVQATEKKKKKLKSSGCVVISHVVRVWCW